MARFDLKAIEATVGCARDASGALPANEARVPRDGEPRARAVRALALALGLLVVVGAGCTELAPGEDTLDPIAPLPSQGGTTGMDTNPLEPGPDPVWGCIDGEPPGTGQALRPSVGLSLGIVDANTGMPPAGLTARACRRFDAVSCMAPITQPTAVSEDGFVHLVVEYGFDGVVEIESPSTVPTLFFVNEPLFVDTTDSFGVVSPLGLAGLAAQGGVTLETTRGHLFIRAFDCQKTPAQNVELSIDKDGTPFVFNSGLPTVGQRVTSDGSGGFVNVPPGLTRLQGRELEGDRISDSENVLVRAGWFTYGDLVPRAAQPEALR